MKYFHRRLTYDFKSAKIQTFMGFTEAVQLASVQWYDLLTEH